MKEDLKGEGGRIEIGDSTFFADNWKITIPKRSTAEIDKAIKEICARISPSGLFICSTRRAK